MSWTPNWCTSHFAEKVSQRKSILAPKNLTNVYKSVIEPYFDFCSIVWDTLSIKLNDKEQNRAERIITGATYTAIRSKEVLEKLRWLSLKQKRSEQKPIMMKIFLTTY